MLKRNPIDYSLHALN